MENRFENERYRRSEDEGWGGQQPSRRRGDEYGRGFGRGGHSYDREENYFGSGRQQFGDSYTGTDRERGSYVDDVENRYPWRGASRGRSQFETSAFDPGSSYDRDRGEYGNTYGSPGSFGRRDLSGHFGGQRPNQYESGNYGDAYAGSERGYQTGRGGYNQDRGWWDRASDEVSSWFGDKDAERRRNMDERNDRTNRGRGPRNYSRSDERITEDVNDRLTDDYMLDASDIDVTVSSGEVTLSGTVNNRQAKRRAEDIAESVSGVKNVENRIRVNESSTGSSSYTNGSTETSTGMSRGKSA